MPDSRVKFLYLIAKLLSYAEKHDIEVVCFTFHRSPEQQLQEYIKGKSKIKSGGPHQKWTAMDLAIVKNGAALFDNSEETFEKYRILGDYWVSLNANCIWGGTFNFAKDIYHFELASGVENQYV